ncbi:MAG: DUF4012 domain-containing protein [Candidatus Magasanikbacteria bacterium]|nr:DUF4012 domain-containing protein [Candidatus Magasanikbacteria bacterium]
MMKWLKILGLLIVIIGGAGLAVRWGWRSGRLPQVAVRQVGERLGLPPAELSLMETALGFGGPRTYLILFLNNTELRPGGGFIGAYALLKINRGIPQLVKIEGTELLDGRAKREALPPPPDPIREYLKVDRWYFRDSNWSPDFASSSARALELYGREGGEAAGEIDGVAGVTATVLEELVRILGPIDIAGEVWRADNIVERLEYEVEYGYRERGRKFSERKQPLAELAGVLGTRLQQAGWRRGKELLTLAGRLVKEKHLLFYAVAPAEQQALLAAGWAGHPTTSSVDYLFWVDANLGALKTDAALERSLQYQIIPTSTGYLARATMTFSHRGKLDWRTSRYRDYVRIFAPGNSILQAVTSSGALADLTSPDSGREGSRQWFGAWFTLPAGREGSLTFEYLVAPAAAQALGSGSYSLAIDKQAGTLAQALTVDLDFGTKVRFARPPEAPEEHGDMRYRYQTDLRVNREFEIKIVGR